MRLLFLGDVVGQPGLNLVRKTVPMLRQRERLDLVVANAENTTNGSGLAPRDYKLIRSVGVDALTMGDHIYKKYELADILRDEREPICKPANYPPEAPGRDHVLLNVNGLRVLVISLLGRTFTRPVDCPFAAVDRVLKQVPADIRIIDMHAEATADKYLMFHHLMGRVTAVLGTHTHIPTADEQVRNGTAFQCDVGMCGPFDSILGRRVDRVMQTAIQFVPTSFDVASDDVRLCGVIVDVDDRSGKAEAIERVCYREVDLS